MVAPSLESWATLAALWVGSSIHAAISRKGSCSLMLTGGHTAKRLYKIWAQSDVLPFSRMKFFFGDERCVPPVHSDSNYGMVKKTLFANARQLDDDCLVRMEAEDADRDAAAKRYERLLPNSIDILLLGMGTDGHVASLFPYSEALRESQRAILPVVGPKYGYPRLSITPKVIAEAEKVFLLVTGADKGRVLADAIRHPKEIMYLPVRLALNGFWLLDRAAACQLK